MSADNWCICPVCKQKTDKANEDRLLLAAEQYGKIPAKQYIAVAKAAAIPKTIEETFREDFDIGIDDEGTFSVSYRGACQDCNAEFTYRFENTSAIVEEPTP